MSFGETRARRIAAVALLGLCMTACGGGDHSGPVGGVTYRLTAGSVIVFSPGPPAADAVVEEALSGTFVAVRVSPVLAPHTLFTFTIRDLHFKSRHFAVRGESIDEGACVAGDMGEGCMEAPEDTAVGTVVAGIVAHVDSYQRSLNGIGSFEGTSTSPVLRDLQLCEHPQGGREACTEIRGGTEGGYAITIFATPVG